MILFLTLMLSLMSCSYFCFWNGDIQLIDLLISLSFIIGGIEEHSLIEFYFAAEDYLAIEVALEDSKDFLEGVLNITGD